MVNVKLINDYTCKSSLFSHWYLIKFKLLKHFGKLVAYLLSFSCSIEQMQTNIATDPKP